jgi:hypothetical protein
MEKELTTKMFVVSTKIFVDDEIVVLNAVLWASAGLRPFDLLRSLRAGSSGTAEVAVSTGLLLVTRESPLKNV